MMMMIDHNLTCIVIIGFDRLTSQMVQRTVNLQKVKILR